MAPTTEHMLYWADVGDNRIGPLIRELIEAIADCEDPEQIKRISVRLKFLSSSVNSYANNLKGSANGR